MYKYQHIKKTIKINHMYYMAVFIKAARDI